MFKKEKKEKNEEDEEFDDEEVPYSFYLEDVEILNTLDDAIKAQDDHSIEKVTEIVYQPHAKFRCDIFCLNAFDNNKNL